MAISQNNILRNCAFVAVFVLLTGFVCVAQQPAPGQPSLAAGQSATAEMNAEREQVWNSPSMLRARAWLQEYCQASAKITPEEGAKYQDELSKLTPIQMKLWLLKFDHERELQHQQDASWQMVHQAERAQSIAAINETRRAYADYNQEESAAAGQEDQQLATQSQDAQDMSELKAEEPTDPYSIGARGFYPYGGIQYHYHYHLYPNPK